MPKIISECCELVKLCHINCNGPDFLRQLYMSAYYMRHFMVLQCNATHTECTDVLLTVRSKRFQQSAVYA